jgi:hypothetical protein
MMKFAAKLFFYFMCAAIAGEIALIVGVPEGEEFLYRLLGAFIGMLAWKLADIKEKRKNEHG